MRAKLPLAVLAAAALAAAGPAPAAGFADAWQAARQFEAQYRAAGHELEVSRHNVPLIRSTLLPNVSLQASTSFTAGQREFPNQLNQDVRVPLDYSSPQASLQLRSPLFNYESLSRYRQAGAQLESAEALYELRGLELADRLGTAYVQALLANENVRLVDAEIVAFEGQLARSQQRLQRGEGTRTEVAQTQASLDMARARRIESEDQLELARRTLRRLTGIDLTQLKSLPDNFVPPRLVPASLQEWLDRAEQQSPALRSRRSTLEVSRLGIDRSKAGHLPRLDLVASLGRFRNESITSLNQTSTLRSVGVQLSVPLFAGGGVEAGIAQALAESARVAEELRLERETLQSEVQRQFSFATSSVARVDAYRRVVESADTALEGATRALAAGLATNTDVLDAQARRFTALRDLAQARFEGLIARYRLQLQAGSPVAEVVDEIDRLLTRDLALTRIPTKP